jgi:hypothetical protein
MARLAEFEDLCATGRDDRAVAALEDLRAEYLYLGRTFESSSLLDEITMLVERFRDFPAAAAKSRLLINQLKAGPLNAS